MAIRKCFLSVFILFLSLQEAFGLTLHFQYIVDDGSGQIAADNYYAFGVSEAGVSETLDSSDLRKPPALPGASTHIQTIANSTALIGDFRFMDTVLPNHSWPVELSLVGLELSGAAEHTLKLLDTEELAALPEDALLYLRRYDSSGTFLEYYDITQSDNHTVVWHTESPDNPTALIDLVVVGGCIAANLDEVGAIDFKDFAVLADYWMLDGVYGTADIDGSDTANLDDVIIMAQHWLMECLPSE